MEATCITSITILMSMASMFLLIASIVLVKEFLI